MSAIMESIVCMLLILQHAAVNRPVLCVNFWLFRDVCFFSVELSSEPQLAEVLAAPTWKNSVINK